MRLCFAGLGYESTLRDIFCHKQLKLVHTQTLSINLNKCSPLHVQKYCDSQNRVMIISILRINLLKIKIRKEKGSKMIK